MARQKKPPAPGNMKFSMNGALTIGTLDGAQRTNPRAGGPETFLLLFGLTAEQVHNLKASGLQPLGVSLNHQLPC